MAMISRSAQAERFTVGRGDVKRELEQVQAFKYLGRLLTFDDRDGQAVRANLTKARKCWARLSRVLRAENATPAICGTFYLATVQAVLLFGSEGWNITPSAMAPLEGFHL